MSSYLVVVDPKQSYCSKSMDQETQAMAMNAEFAKEKRDDKSNPWLIAS